MHSNSHVLDKKVMFLNITTISKRQLVKFLLLMHLKNYNIMYNKRLIFIARIHCHNCWHHCQTYQQREECFLLQGHARQNHDGHCSVREIPYFPPPCLPFNKYQMMTNISEHIPTTLAPALHVQYNAYIKQSKYPTQTCYCFDGVWRLWIFTLSSRLSNSHSLHQYAPEYSCQKISAIAPHQDGDSSLYHTK